jgi:hypothetical protein
MNNDYKYGQMDGWNGDEHLEQDLDNDFYDEACQEDF